MRKEIDILKGEINITEDLNTLVSIKEITIEDLKSIIKVDDIINNEELDSNINTATNGIINSNDHNFERINSKLIGLTIMTNFE